MKLSLRTYLLGAVVAVFALLILSVTLANRTADFPPARLSAYGDNVRAGFGAQTVFQVNWGAPPLSDQGRRYLLNAKPDAEEYEIESPGLQHLQHVTLEPKGESPFVFEMTLHGRPDSSVLAVRVPDLDLRKFLHASIVPQTGDSPLARVQAHFAEFSRKTKILYRAKDQAAETSLEAALSSSVAALRSGGEWSEGMSEDLGWIEGALRREGPPPLAPLDARLRRIARNFDGDAAARASLRKLQKTLVQAVAGERITTVTVVNNCREPGNYEIALRDGIGRSLFRASFSFPRGEYDNLLRQYHGLGISEQGTGLQFAAARGVGELWRVASAYLSWSAFKSFPEARVAELAELREGTLRAGGELVAQRGELAVTRGRIPFEDYEVEVRHKSSFRTRYREPLSYVGVNADRALPVGFQSPAGESPKRYWSDSTNQGKVVPHRFSVFEDLQNHDVYLSGFAVDGVYIGRSDFETFDRERSEGRWPFDYGYLPALTRYELRGDIEREFEVRVLSSSSSSGTQVNFILGNLSVPVGQSVELMLGIGAQPLIADYNENVLPSPIHYALAFGRDGHVLDHHTPGIGVERVSIQRPNASQLRIRLISHERILPVWEATAFLVDTGQEAGAAVSRH